MDERVLRTFEASLRRCSDDPTFLDRFYEHFLASSFKVRDKFNGTNFERQRVALRASFDLLLSAARDGEGGAEKHLGGLAERHGAGQLAIGAEYYDYWLDSLLRTVRTCDPAFTSEVEAAWEAVMGVGIRFLCSRYNQ